MTKPVTQTTPDVIDLNEKRGEQFFKKIPDHLKPYALEHVKWCKLWSNDSLEAAAIIRIAYPNGTAL